MIPTLPIPTLKLIHYGDTASAVLPEPPKNLLDTCPPYAQQLKVRSRYKALYGGRGGGKSHALATLMLQRLLDEPDLQCLCLREVQLSLKYSSKLLLEKKIAELGLGAFFQIQHNIIKRRGGSGFIIFKGMQDHTAESVKSFEGFDIAWWEESQSASKYSLDLLDPTIRKEGSEIWFSWNPDQADDPVDRMFRGANIPADALIIPVSFRDNPLISETLLQLQERSKEADQDTWEWVWNGGYNIKSIALIFAGRWREGIVDTSTGWDGPYYGGDFGFSADPCIAVECWIAGHQIYVRRGKYRYRLENDEIPAKWCEDVPGIESQTLRADSSLPATVSYLQRHGLPKILGATKGPGSVKSGTQWLRSHFMIIHPDAADVQLEAKRHRYKQNKGGDVTEEIVDADNHGWDAVRYAFEPLILEDSAGKSARYWATLTQ